MVLIEMVRVGAVTKRYLCYGAVGVLLVSFGLAIADEFNTILAWWIAIILLLPLLLWALKTPYVALKTICISSFLTQFITLPFFYLRRDTFAWGHVKPFHFTGWEAFPMLAKVSLFMFALIVFFKWLYPISLFGGRSCSDKGSSPFKDHQNKYFGFDVRKNRKTLQFSLLLILLIMVLTAINLWSYSQGIGLTGVEPPRLPYRLSGILYYLMKYITPPLLGYLYLKTKRSWFLMLLFLFYAWVLGLCSISKGSVIVVMLPVVALAWIDKRKIMLTVASLCTIIGVSFASGARAYVYITTATVRIGADTSFGIFHLIAKMFNDPKHMLWDFNFIPLLINVIFSRIEGFNNLVMAQYYDPDAVIGAWGFILRMIWRGLSGFDTDLHSMQWQGNVLPKGFYNGGALLSNAVIVGNSGLWWIVLSAMVTAGILVILEKSTKRIARKYKTLEFLPIPLIFFLTMIFFTTIGGTVTFVFPLVLLFIASWLPPIVVRKNKRRRSKSSA
jgi:hypothetical protein